MTSRRTTVTVLLLAGLVAVLVGTVRADDYYSAPGRLSLWYAAAWLLFAAGLWALRKAPDRTAVVLVMAGAVAVAATGLVAPPRTSTDSYRYAWDGRVQAAGISPYDHVPAAPELVPLRDAWLFPEGRAACAGPDRAPVGDGVCTRINRPRVNTVYPPVAEGYFLLVETLSPEGARHKPLQTGGALLSVATAAALLLVLRRRGAPWRAAYWAWCPAVPVEAVNNAHVDVLGVLFSVAALVAVVRHRAAGGALLGVAVAAKLLPAVLIPGALSGVRRARDALAVLLPAAGVVAVLYLPYVLVSRGSVLGFLGGYVEEEGYDDASARNRYALLRLLLPDDWTLPVVAAAMLAVVAYVVLRGDPERPWSGALVVTGTAFLLLTPGYSWYALLLVALVALDGRWEWLGIAVAGAAKYVTGPAFPGHGDTVGTIAYATAAAAVLTGWVLRRRTVRGRPQGTRRAGPPASAEPSGNAGISA
ncbi:glycosyltransferase 87 family protein [Streptomyces sp. HNM0645]|uniref:glycosyltransferase 87 family protein n=1 Tax=Streptomyces sp. HNM0645 TaxID=2782343 RepID=UPI0024B70C34|nr:glycosyltransferase 87 family protein [Streptomyces sp. HNM0645]MDI9884417.1 glycosyltransferase 87 family protein [Streptomyces sp. HNM0645]